MKKNKKISVVLGVIVMTLVASWNMFQCKNKVLYSELTLENIEALAENELNHCEICYGFELKYYSVCRVCELIGGDEVVCNIHDQIPC